MGGLKAVELYRRLRFELLEGRLMMSGDTTLASTALNIQPTSSTGQPAVIVGGQVPTAPYAPGGAQTVVQEADGTLLVAGVYNDVPGDIRFEVAHYLANGALDLSFGTGGYTQVGNFKFGASYVQQIKLASDGSIYVVGEVGDPDQSARSIPTLVHITAGGSIDQSYGQNGILSLNDALWQPVATIQNDGKIVVTGTAFGNNVDGFPVTSMVVNRFKADGSIDSSFQPTSLKTFANPSALGIEAIFVDQQGRILLAGYRATGQGAAVLRVNADGSVDRSFGQGGYAGVPFPAGAFGQLVMTEQADGRILLATTGVDSSGFDDYVLGRLNANGQLDSSFNGTGFAIASISANVGFSSPNRAPNGGSIGALVVQPDGKIIISSMASSQYGSWQPAPVEPGGAVPMIILSYAVDPGITAARFNADGTMDASYGGGGAVWYPKTMGSEGDAILLSDGGLLGVGSNPWIPGSGQPAEFDLIKVDIDGSLDEGFGVAAIPAQIPVAVPPINLMQSAPPVGSAPTDSTGPLPATQASATTAVIGSAPVVVPVVTAPVVGALTAPTPTIVTNPVSTPASVVSQPAAPTPAAAAASFLLGDTGLSTDADDSADDLADRLAAFDLVHTLASD